MLVLWPLIPLTSRSGTILTAGTLTYDKYLPVPSHVALAAHSSGLQHLLDRLREGAPGAVDTVCSSALQSRAHQRVA